MTTPLPERPSLEHLKKQAKAILKSHESGDPSACTILRHLRRFSRASDQELLNSDLSLAEAQYALATDYGFASWNAMKEAIEGRLRRLESSVRATDIPGLKRYITGKVRDVYDLGDSLLLVASDRISVFDVVLPGGIPDKGRVLTQLSMFWFELTRDIVTNHVITADVDEIIEHLKAAGVPNAASYRGRLDGRSILGAKAEAVPVECVVRGYLAGSAWKDYSEFLAEASGSKTVNLHGIELPTDMKQCQKLTEPIYTPAVKATSGHDENISADKARELHGRELVDELERLSIAIYKKASEYAASRGVIISDTKFEFGMRDGKIILIDEILTPDSSRFWPADDYQPGRDQASFDKQFARNYVLTLDWDKTYPGPELPEGIVEKTSERYREAYERITGNKLP
jgi:phosphoribosylaminoimidazole-succinocarboxamide synthase